MADSQMLQALPTILQRLHATYPDARYELDWDTPEHLLVATILAAQCTDEKVNEVTRTLFPKYPDARAFAEADLTELEEDLKPTGFYRQKARTVQAVCRDLVERFAGNVPRTIEEMTTLPGVARKTANVVLNNAFRMPTGVIVDTHVQRVSQRMGLTVQKKPEKIERDLMQFVPEEEWVFFGPAMVLLGRYVCTHHSPRCAECVMNDVCPRIDVGAEREGDLDPDRNMDGQADEETPDAEEDTPPMASRKSKPVNKSKKPQKKKPTVSSSAARAKLPTPSASSLRDQLPADWQAVLKEEFDKPYFKKLEAFVAQQRAQHTVYPPAEDVFNAFRATPFEQVKVLLLGQDPYHGAGEAHGMCFSVRAGVKPPPSLVNIFKELQADLGCTPASHGCLTAWAEQGVLLLNTVLTVRASEPASHKDQGWEPFTDAVIRALGRRPRPVVFLLWGSQAQKKKDLIDTSRNRVLEAAHPSPLSAKKFFGSKPFSSANQALTELGQEPITWQLPESSTGTVAPVVAKPAPVAPPVPVREESTRLEALLPADWRAALAGELKKPSFHGLDRFLAGERRDATVYPDEPCVFAALYQTPLAAVRVVLLGQEPPCTDDVADGLAYSVREGVDPSDTQQTLFRELRHDLGCRIPTTGSLEPWARQGVLLLNSALTVRAGRPGSHRDKGWEPFVNGVLEAVNANPDPVVFVLLGPVARKKQSLIDESRHVVLTGEHPAMAPETFIGSGIFSAINNALELRGRSAIYWQLRYV